MIKNFFRVEPKITADIRGAEVIINIPAGQADAGVHKFNFGHLQAPHFAIKHQDQTYALILSDKSSAENKTLLSFAKEADAKMVLDSIHHSLLDPASAMAPVHPTDTQLSRGLFWGSFAVVMLVLYFVMMVYMGSQQPAPLSAAATIPDAAQVQELKPEARPIITPDGAPISADDFFKQ
jgi:hypothetical protein